MDMTLRIPRELVSPNQWNGRHWRVKHRISQEWEEEIGIARMWTDRRVRSDVSIEQCQGGPAAVGCHEDGRVRVSITREVPSGRNFIRDDDNLRFCVKPLLDALKRQGYIKNDSRKWIELPTPEQRISADGKYWTVIALQAVEGSGDASRDRRPA